MWTCVTGKEEGTDDPVCVCVSCADHNLSTISSSFLEPIVDRYFSSFPLGQIQERVRFGESSLSLWEMFPNTLHLRLAFPVVLLTRQQPLLHRPLVAHDSNQKVLRSTRSSLSGGIDH